MMIDSFGPEGFTRLGVDSIFMMPQLGVLARIHPEASTQVFERDCLIHIGTVIAPVGQLKEGEHALTITMTSNTMTSKKGASETFKMKFGELKAIELGADEEAVVTVNPARGLDVGAGRGTAVTRTVTGGVSGLIIDTRGRPLQLPGEPSRRVAMLEKWYTALDMYPAAKDAH